MPRRPLRWTLRPVAALVALALVAAAPVAEAQVAPEACDADLPPEAPTLWGGAGVTAEVVLDPTDAPIGVRDAGEATLRRAIDEWNARPGSAVELRWGGRRTDVEFAADDGIVAVVWLPLEAGIAATFVQPGAFAEIVDADIALDPEQLWSVDGSVPSGIDLATVLRHELGHVLGLRHVEASAPRTGSTMDGCLAFGERRGITDDAAAEAVRRYPDRRQAITGAASAADGAPGLVSVQRRLVRRRTEAGWEPLGAPALAVAAAGAPAWVVDGEGRAELLVVDSDGALQRTREARPDQWSRWQVLGTGFGPGVAATIDGVGRLVVLAVATDGPVRWRAQTDPGGRWGPWLDAGIDAGPEGVALTTGPDGTPVAAVVGPDGAVSVAVRVDPEGPWGPWTSVAGISARGAPAVVVGRRGRLEVFAVGPDGALAHTEQTDPGGPWRPWRAVGGPAVATGLTAAGRDVVATAVDGLTTLHSHRATDRPHGWTRLTVLPAL